MLTKELGKTIKERRNTLGITQVHLAELAEVNTNTIIRIENGKINPTIQVVDRIAEVLGMELTLKVKPTNP
jgi:y4mF family transcriptional regulator